MQTTTLATTQVTTVTAPPAVTITRQRNSLWWDAFRRLRRNKVAVVSFIVILGYASIAILAAIGVLFPNVAIPNQAPAYSSFSFDHPFGTDIFGRDVLARAVHGTATAFSIGIIASGLSLIIGTFLGAIAGYFGEKIDALITWLYTTVDSIPYILLIPSLAFIMGRGLTTIYIAVGITSWVSTCRLIRAEFLKHKSRDYVAAATALGASHKRRIFNHILPNVLHIAFIQFGLGFVAAIKTEVILTFLGIGVDPSTPSWGIMIDDAKLELARPFWGNLTAATIFMFGLVLSFNLFNDGLREAFDPKLKNK